MDAHRSHEKTIFSGSPPAFRSFMFGQTRYGAASVVDMV